MAAVTLVAALIATGSAGVPLRDPHHVTLTRLAIGTGLVALLIAADAGVRRARGREQRWTRRRLAVVAVTVISFFVTYLAYRNLKSVVPLLRPGDLFDGQLADVDRSLFGGHDPGAVLHDALGTGFAAHALSAVYMLFFAFIPVAIATALAFSRDIRRGVFFVTALTLNWAVGAITYFLLPSIGPFHTDPASFAGLPGTAVTHMQATLVGERAAFIADPGAAGAAQSIGAFASLHTSIYVTAALAAHLLGFPRVVKIAIWVLTALTATATIYFGWHYLLDDVAGIAIAVVALAAARVLTGFDLRTARQPRRVSVSPLPGAA